MNRAAGWAILVAMLAFAWYAEPARAVMPDRAATPGATNPSVTQANIAQTVCRAGWTKTIRPPASYTNKLKRAQLAAGVYRSRLPPGNFEEDHLISLELGGHPTSEKNLWPEPYNPLDKMGARVKDQVEDFLKREVCARRMTLAEAQAAVVDWEATYRARVASRRK